LGCLIIHHVGLADDQRLRGHTSLIGGLDVSILSERKEGTLSAVMTVKKEKDEESDQKFKVYLERVEISLDEDGDGITTLVIGAIEDGAADQVIARSKKSIPRSQRMLLTVVEEAIEEEGEPFMVLDGPNVQAAPELAVRRRYYARIAETAEPGEDPENLAQRQKKGFKRAAEAAVKSELIMAQELAGVRYFWLPAKA
jgi:hypothetical protein